MNESFKTHIELEHHQLAVELQTSQSSIKILELAIDKLQKEINTLKTTNVAKAGAPENPPGTGGILIPGTIPPALHTPRVAGTTSIFKFTFEAGEFQVGVEGRTMGALADARKAYRTGCTWLDITSAECNMKFQHGIYTTLDGPIKGDKLPLENLHTVTFAHPYAKPPTVLLWLTGFQMFLDNPWRLKTFATDVTEKGFTIHINTWRDTEMLSAGVAWVAYPTGDTEVHSARLETQPPGSWKHPSTYRESWQKPNCGGGMNRRLMVVDSIEVSQRGKLSLMLYFHSTRNTISFKWGLKADPANVLLYSLGANYMLLK